MERHYLTPSLRQAISRLERVGTSMTAFPRGRRRGQRIPVGKGEARKALTAVTTATDIHTINAKGDLCVGDDVVFVREHVEITRGRAGGFSSRTLRSYSYTLEQARIDHISPGITRDTDELHLRFEDGHSEVVRASIASINGIWRKPWARENERDGCAAELITQRELARDDMEQYGQTVAF